MEIYIYKTVQCSAIGVKCKVLISKTDDIEFFSDFPFFGLKGEVRIEMLIRIFNQHNHNSFILLFFSNLRQKIGG